MADVWQRELGTVQGRVTFPEDSLDELIEQVIEGESVFLLGSLSREGGRLEAGDFAQVDQDVNIGASDNYLRLGVLLLGSPDWEFLQQQGLAWRVALLIDSVEQVTVTVPAGTARGPATLPLTDLAAHISKISGVHNVAVRLRLETL